MPLLSIIIPTHNRQLYAAITTRKIAEICPEAEIVVSDTSDDESLAREIDDLLGTGKVKYVRQPSDMDVVSHFEATLDHISGEFIFFIGDDDCIGPEAYNIVQWAKRNDVDAIISYADRFIANYYWPGIRSKYYGDKYAGNIFINRFSSQAIPIDAGTAIRHALHNLGRGLGAMPRAYHGIVSRTLVERVIARHGALFGGVSPDIYSAILISSEARNPWCVDFPFCLPGGSPPSTAGSGAARSDTPKLYEHSHIIPFKNLRWDPLVPEYYSPYNVWAFSAKKAVDQLGSSAFRPNFPRLYACCLLYGRNYGDAVRKAVAAHTATFGWWRTYPAITRELAREITHQAKRLAARAMAPRAGGSAKSIGDLATIAAAYDALDARCRQDSSAPVLPELQPASP